jgi:hypothetical protein
MPRTADAKKPAVPDLKTRPKRVNLALAAFIFGARKLISQIGATD